MNTIKEYLSILKTDPKVIINSTYDKSSTLNAYVDQLEFRYKKLSFKSKKPYKTKRYFYRKYDKLCKRNRKLKI